MVAKEMAPENGESKRFLVQCDDCQFEQLIIGRDAARRIAINHRSVTDHNIVAAEMPRPTGSFRI